MSARIFIFTNVEENRGIFFYPERYVRVVTLSNDFIAILYRRKKLNELLLEF